jgi:pimeloyl-ACP methyl ester carboxylesterase
MILQLLHRTVRTRIRSLGFESRTLGWDHGSLHYLLREHADAKGTLVLVHGLGTSSSTWLRMMPHVEGGYRIVALDLPGFGFSASNAEKGFSTLSEHVKALSVLMNEISHGPVILLGQSLGGWVCCRYAASVPKQIQQLVLVDAAGVYYQGAEQLRDLFTLRSVSDTRRLLTNLWYKYPWYFKPFAGSIYRELLRRHMNELVASVQPDDLLADELRHLTMPVSIIWGKQDAVIPVQCVDVFKKSIPHAAVHIIDRCGHVPQLERPEEFARILNQVLQV